MEPFTQRVKRQRRLIVVFFVILAITLSILYFGYFRKKKTLSPPSEITFPEKKVEIDFSVLESPILRQFQPFEKIEHPSPEEIGRENPFLPIK
jgi:hypothetical protein